MTRARDMADLGSSAATLETTVANKSGKNLIINGAMQVAQRGTTFAALSGYGLDRFSAAGSNDGAVTVTQDTTVPSDQGFKYSMKFDVTTADTSLAAAQYYQFFQKIEGQNISQLKLGTSNAKTFTLSFWCRSSKAGVYNVVFTNGAVDRFNPNDFTINSADTWEKKTITVSGDQTGTWLTTNGIGMYVIWNLALGSNYDDGTNGTWGSADYGSGNNVNFLDSTSNDFYITGVQLEVGDTATPFEHKFYADYEWDCQRYYHMVKEGSGTYMIFATGRAWGTGGANGPYKFPRVMRASPTMTAGGAASDYDFGISAVPAAGSVTLNNDMMVINVSGSFTTGQIIVIGSNAGGSGPAALMFDAEL